MHTSFSALLTMNYIYYCYNFRVYCTKQLQEQRCIEFFVTQWSKLNLTFVLFLQSLSGHSTPVDCVRFSITEEQVWRYCFKFVKLLHIQNFTLYIYEFQVCAGSAAGALKIWDLESAKMLRTLTGHRASIRCVDFHPYGDFLASGSSDSGIKVNIY